MHAVKMHPDAPFAKIPAGQSCFLEARNLGFSTRKGVVFEGVNIKLNPGQVCALRGHNGTGKSSLLLCLAGHMMPSQGSLRVGNYKASKDCIKIQRNCGKGIFAGLNDLQMSLNVSYAVKSEFGLIGRKTDDAHIMAYLREWDLADVANLRVSDLTSKKLVRLGVALACAGHPAMIVIDDIEDELTLDQSVALMDMLKRIAQERQMLVVVGVVERQLAAMADCAVYLEKEDN